MLIIRTPLRVSLFGGGTDIDPFMSLHGGQVLSLAIRKYIYISIHPLVESSDILLKYSRNEKVGSADEVQHRVFRAVLTKYGLSGIDISVSADIAAGTGLGSSSAFTVGLINLIENYLGSKLDRGRLADMAAEIEIDVLNEPIGIQDQYAADFGGVNLMEFHSRTNVNVIPISMTRKMEEILNENMILVRIPGTRSASNILLHQKSQMFSSKSIEALQQIKQHVSLGLEAWQDSASALGELLHQSWVMKQRLSESISNIGINDTYNLLRSRGFYGGKLLGAGGSGYMLLVGSKDAVHTLSLDDNFNTTPIQIDFGGSKVIYSSDDE